MPRKILGNSLQTRRKPERLRETSDSVDILSPPSKRARLAIPVAEIDSERICDRCSEFDFESIFDPSNETPPSAGRPIGRHVGAITAATEASACPLCRLFAAVRFPREVTVSNPSGHYHLRSWSTLKMYGSIKTKARTVLKPSIVIAVEQGNPVKNYRFGGYLMSHGVIAPVVSDPSQSLKRFTLFGSPVDSKAVNFSRVRKWLRHCETLHADVCEALVTSQLNLLRVINCDTMEIVPMATLPSNIQYFALSYVWGLPNPNTNTDDASSLYSTSLLCSQIPQVIQDAIEVVKNLREEGQRYLWVDKYCIDQNNTMDKHRQVKSMDSIYERAIATIVAASGDGAECGLPGIGPVPRLPQPAALVNGKQLVSTLPHISIALKDTAWITRGWTYQEAMLSRRCIVFTDLQVYFICRKSTCCEAMNKHNDLRAPGDELPNALFEPRVISGPRIKGELALFSDYVAHYSQRKLTQETDALDAFKGILARSPFHSYWGVPMVDSVRQDAPDVGFAKGLAWKGGLYRRQRLPSWSWTGWTGSITFYLEHFTGFTIFDGTFWAELPGDDQKLVSLKSLRDAAGDRKVIEEISSILHVEAYTMKVWFQRPRSTGSDHKLRPEIYAVFCWKHPDTECECQNTYGSAGRGIHLNPKNYSDERVFCQPWDGVLLTSGAERESVDVLIIEWHGSTAQRVGILSSAMVDVITSLPKVWRKIRLE
jgi:hypothetical protein